MRFVKNRPLGTEEDSTSDGTLKKRIQIGIHDLLIYASVNVLHVAPLSQAIFTHCR